MEQLVAELQTEDFYRYAWPDYRWPERLKSAKAGATLTEETGRVFTLDAEVVYESGPRDFIQEIEPFLAAIGAPIEDFTEVKHPDRYGIRLNGRELVLVTRDDAQAGSAWFLPSIRFLRVLDELLEASPAQERIYYGHIDNDSTVAFLTERMLEILRALAEVTRQPMPRLSRPLPPTV